MPAHEAVLRPLISKYDIRIRSISVVTCCVYQLDYNCLNNRVNNCYVAKFLSKRASLKTVTDPALEKEYCFKRE